ncbi:MULTISPECIES: anhydro-N-acetylmuramic acid kinase [unclassified Paracoccus (in: a-proteobacteria)]|uniref:anhydro-N-acetylmuramic acid kinase n=1 Tax=unclassified Paracoccus (in: a-proteobacteria) TaxID=2688777 RepID=UPI0016015E64|nr:MULTISPECIES: anhydro-N-acetylmuramic acid kinase [unclassified Paracoccus (in: a-proteobacteria)]MBB1490064.1 anhydro-N-acetylmuramic acid kinase [Paracoccus sp. MC1854]MBB1496652.1 anhydro-N-acetylmuramic acid kinase [Paracoccus sp. MC1862]QQO43668.1 anhydro-N-acetylmuramic acid kinase [Paracoccus sp. MC1862]
MLVLGMMSGTSLDGVDAAVLDTDGEAIFGFGRVGYRAYSAEEAEVLHAALRRWPGEPGVAEAAALSVRAHAALAADFPEADLIGYHGQTLAHDPGAGRTHQAGQGWELARATGRRTVWDFRTEDVRQGGEGAPLAPFFHHALARWAVGQGRLSPEPVVFLNLGGVGNLTWCDPRNPDPLKACVAFDTGPANAPLNDLIRARRGVPRDEGGALAAQGNPRESLILDFLRHPYFARPAPKSLDRDSFAMLAPAVAQMEDADAAATLTHTAAAAVAAGLGLLPSRPASVLVCGGGRHNAAMMRALADRCGLPVRPVEDVGLDGDMIEAQAFAWLAARVLRGLPTSGPGTTGAPGAVCGGRISPPCR